MKWIDFYRGTADGGRWTANGSKIANPSAVCRPSSAIFFLILFLITSCSPIQHADNSPKHSPFTHRADQAQILFFNLSIRKVEQKSEVRLVETKVVDGLIKKDFPKESDYQNYQLLCSFLDQNQEVIKQTAVDHPLYKNYEFQNGNGQLQTKMVYAEEGQFTLRTQLTKDMRQLQIEEILDNGKMTFLQLINL